jgi:hypothetical protein
MNRTINMYEYGLSIPSCRVSRLSLLLASVVHGPSLWRQLYHTVLYSSHKTKKPSANDSSGSIV